MATCIQRLACHDSRVDARSDGPAPCRERGGSIPHRSLRVWQRFESAITGGWHPAPSRVFPQRCSDSPPTESTARGARKAPFSRTSEVGESLPLAREWAVVCWARWMSRWLSGFWTLACRREVVAISSCAVCPTVQRLVIWRRARV